MGTLRDRQTYIDRQTDIEREKLSQRHGGNRQGGREIYIYTERGRESERRVGACEHFA